MQKIDLKKLIKQNKLDKKEVAKQLFPANKFPDLALKRVTQGKALLNSDQLSKLSLIANLQISELYGLEWKCKRVAGLVTFTSNNFKAELDSNTWVTKIYDSESLFHESIIHSGLTPLNEYISAISKLVTNHKKQI